MEVDIQPRGGAHLLLLASVKPQRALEQPQLSQVSRISCESLRLAVIVSSSGKHPRSDVSREPRTALLFHTSLRPSECHTSIPHQAAALAGVHLVPGAPADLAGKATSSHTLKDPSQSSLPRQAGVNAGWAHSSAEVKCLQVAKWCQVGLMFSNILHVLQRRTLRGLNV